MLEVDADLAGDVDELAGNSGAWLEGRLCGFGLLRETSSRGEDEKRGGEQSCDADLGHGLLPVVADAVPAQGLPAQSEEVIPFPSVMV